METGKPEIHITDEANPQIHITENEPPEGVAVCDPMRPGFFDNVHQAKKEFDRMNEKKKEEPKPEEPSHILRLKMLSQIARKLAYWIDNETEIPAWVHEKINTSLASMKQASEYLMDQTVDVSKVNEDSIIETRLVPSKPEMWERAKIEGRKRFAESEDKAQTYASKWYKEHGGNWKKKNKTNE